MDGWKSVGFVLCVLVLFESLFNSGGDGGGNSEVDKIIQAKTQVRAMVNYPDTLDFHEMKTNVDGDTVNLTFTASNAFGVPETHTVSIIAD